MRGSILAMVMGIIAIAIAFVIFPVVMDAVSTITTHADIAEYTGLASIAKVAPLIVFVGLLASGGFAMYKGVTTIRKKSKAA
ncbi:hypothetical protein ES703_11521 [subsurface metagenome]